MAWPMDERIREALVLAAKILMQSSAAGKTLTDFMESIFGTIPVPADIGSRLAGSVRGPI